jgi:hypothetical protein
MRSQEAPLSSVPSEHAAPSPVQQPAESVIDGAFTGAAAAASWRA